ncbi:MAG: RDD family protein [Flavobacteriales bacterium]|nr:MAG: RDD family protein [Flavobacteriales bacterium]
MDAIRIDTAQNVGVDYEVASLGDRGLAWFFDGLILAGYVIGVFLLLGLGTLNYWNYPGWLLAIIIGLPYLLYDLISEVTMNGQSIGKRARKIKVARMDGGRPSLGQYVMRWVLRPIDSISYLGALVILINGRGQRLGDLAAGTCVVSMRKRTSLDDTLLVQVEQGHVPLYPEAVRLTDGQAQLIKEVLYKNRGDNRALILLQASEKVQALLNVRTDQRPQDFLLRVLKDYVHLTGK